MTVTPLVPAGDLVPGDAASGLDAPLGAAAPAAAAPGFAAMLEDAFARASGSLERADRSEHAFVHGRGGLQEMVLERAQADVAVQLASAAASHVTQSLTTILGMQI